MVNEVSDTYLTIFCFIIILTYWLCTSDREIERDEFKKVMALMRTYNRQGACHKNGLRLGLKVDKSVENGGLVEHFFGKDGNGRLQHDKFVQLLRDLHDEVFKFTPLLSYPAWLDVPF